MPALPSIPPRGYLPSALLTALSGPGLSLGLSWITIQQEIKRCLLLVGSVFTSAGFQSDFRSVHLAYRTGQGIYTASTHIVPGYCSVNLATLRVWDESQVCPFFSPLLPPTQPGSSEWPTNISFKGHIAGQWPCVVSFQDKRIPTAGGFFINSLQNSTISRLSAFKSTRKGRKPSAVFTSWLAFPDLCRSWNLGGNMRNKSSSLMRNWVQTVSSLRLSVLVLVLCLAFLCRLMRT